MGSALSPDVPYLVIDVLSRSTVVRVLTALCITAFVASCAGDSSLTAPTDSPPPADPPPPPDPPPPAPDPDQDGDGILDSVDACPTEPENFNNVFDTDGCPDTAREFYVVVKDDIEAFWDASFTADQLSYSPITLFQAYTQPISSPCGTLGLNNAFYCPLNSGVYYDDNFLAIFLSQVGDGAPAFIISHELGHHVNDLLGWVAPIITLKESELMADCLGWPSAAAPCWAASYQLAASRSV